MEITVRKPTDEEKSEAETWPTWEKEPSEFPWEYSDKETCLIIEGKATVTPEKGEAKTFQAGDYVIFPEGMKCTWNIEENITKHYKFG